MPLARIEVGKQTCFNACKRFQLCVFNQGVLHNSPKLLSRINAAVLPVNRHIALYGGTRMQLGNLRTEIQIESIKSPEWKSRANTGL